MQGIALVIKSDSKNSKNLFPPIIKFILVEKKTKKIIRSTTVSELIFKNVI